MKIYKQILYFIICMTILFLTGCNTPRPKRILNISKAENGNYIVDFTPQNEDSNMSQYEIGVDIGKKVKTIMDNAAFNRPAIRVNEEFINRDLIESAKIYAEYFQQDIKEQIYNKITAKVLHQEAVRLGVEPSSDEIDELINLMINEIEEKKSDFSNYLLGYLKGMNMTLAEYAEQQREATYFSKQREKLWLLVVTEMEKELVVEANKRQISFSEVEKEHFNKYIANLIKKADIEYLDSDIEHIMR